MDWAEENGDRLSLYDFTSDKRQGFIIEFLPYESVEGKIDLTRIGIGDTIVLDRYWGLVRIPTILRDKKPVPMVSDLGKSNYFRNEMDYINYLYKIINMVEAWLGKFKQEF